MRGWTAVRGAFARVRRLRGSDEPRGRRRGNGDGAAPAGRAVPAEATHGSQLLPEDARFLAEHHTDALARIDLLGTFRFATPGCEDLAGYPPGDLVGRKIADFLHGDDIDAVEGAIAEAASQPSTVHHHDQRIRHADGSWLWVRAHFQVVRRPGEGAWEIVAAYRRIDDADSAKRELERAQQRYRLLAENADDIVGCTRLSDGATTFSSPALERVLGHPPESVLGRSQFDWVHPDDWKDVARATAVLAKEGTPQVMEYRLRHADGHYLWVETRLSAVKVPGEGIVEMIGVTRDITRRREAETRLGESEARLRMILASQPDNIFVLDETGEILECFTPREDELLLPPGALAGRRMGDLLPEPALEVLRPAFRDVSCGSEPRAVDFSLTAPAGEIDLEARLLPIGPGRVLAVVRNVTDEREMEAALRESEARALAILEAQPDVMFILDEDTRILDFYAPNESSLPLSPASFLGRTAVELAPDEATEPLQERFRDVLRTGKPDMFEYAPAGSRARRRYEVRTVPLDAERALVILRDITEARRAERERLHLEEAMQRTQKLESLGLLAGGIAHDFNNLLTSMLGNASLALLDLGRDAPSRECVEQIQTAAESARDLTSQLLAYAGKGESDRRDLDLSASLRSMQPLLASGVSHSARLEFRLAPALPAVNADSSQLLQVVMNLLGNASQALGDRAGLVRIRTGVDDVDAETLARATLPGILTTGRAVFLEVEDDGPGMDAATAARVFDPFFTTRETGRGLGLATVAGVTRSHGAALWLETAPGIGTRIRIAFPVSDHLAAAHSERSEIPVEWRGSGCILVVDDERLVRQVARRCLERAGFEVLEARDGAEGVALFRERHREIDAVLLDWKTPGMTGDLAMQAMRGVRADVPVLLSSGYAEEISLNELADRPHTQFLAKPYRAHHLLAAFRTLLA